VAKDVPGHGGVEAEPRRVCQRRGSQQERRAPYI
jgi:hypothetical protein